MTSAIFEGQPPKTRPKTPLKTRVSWVPGFYWLQNFVCFFLSRSASWTLFHNLIEICHLLPRSQEPMAASARRAGDCCILTSALPFQENTSRLTHCMRWCQVSLPLTWPPLTTHNVKNGENHMAPEHLESKTKQKKQISLFTELRSFLFLDKKNQDIPWFHTSIKDSIIICQESDFNSGGDQIRTLWGQNRWSRSKETAAHNGISGNLAERFQGRVSGPCHSNMAKHWVKAVSKPCQVHILTW